MSACLQEFLTRRVERRQRYIDLGLDAACVEFVVSEFTSFADDKLPVLRSVDLKNMMASLIWSTENGGIFWVNLARPPEKGRRVMSDSFTLALGFEVVTCCNKSCLTPFAMTAAMKAARLKDKATFYCPSGHAQHFTAETTEEPPNQRKSRIFQCPMTSAQKHFVAAQLGRVS